MFGEAHAVSAEGARLRYARHDIAAGAHAEREQVVPAGDDQRIVGRAQPSFQRRRAVLDAVDGLLRVFHAHAELERLAFHRRAATQQHLVGVAGAVADGKDHGGRRYVSRRGRQAAHPAVRQIQILDATGEAHLAAQRLDAPAQRLDHGRKAVAAEVRPGVVQHRRLALVVGEQLQHAAHVGAAVATGQFAIAKGSGPAFAE